MLAEESVQSLRGCGIALAFAAVHALSRLRLSVGGAGTGLRPCIAFAAVYALSRLRLSVGGEGVGTRPHRRSQWPRSAHLAVCA